MAVGILALQGAFAEHGQMLDRLGVEHFEIRQLRDLEKKPDRLILPGGESTVMNKLLHELGLYEPIKKLIEDGMPVFGTCAGMILLSRNVEDGSTCFGTMDICVRRNAYGRQLGSFHTVADLKGIGEVPMTFIRAPYVADVSPDVDVLATVDDKIVAVKYGKQFAFSFHPELDSDYSIHKAFIESI